MERRTDDNSVAVMVGLTGRYSVVGLGEAQNPRLLRGYALPEIVW